MFVITSADTTTSVGRDERDHKYYAVRLPCWKHDHCFSDTTSNSPSSRLLHNGDRLEAGGDCCHLVSFYMPIPSTSRCFDELLCIRRRRHFVPGGRFPSATTPDIDRNNLRPFYFQLHCCICSNLSIVNGQIFLAVLSKVVYNVYFRHRGIPTEFSFSVTDWALWRYSVAGTSHLKIAELHQKLGDFAPSNCPDPRRRSSNSTKSY